MSAYLGLGDETGNWKPTKHLKPRCLEVREVSIGRTVHVPNLGLFFHGGPGQMRFKAGIQWIFGRFWVAFLVQDPKNHKYVVLYLNIYGNDE